MPKSLYVFFLVFIFKFNLYLNYVIDRCPAGEKYSTFTMNCSSGNLVPELSNCQDGVREDGLKCLIGNNPSQKNYFGGYFNETQKLNSSGYQNVIIDMNIYNNINDNNKCSNESLILCQQLINVCILKLLENKNNAYCNKYNEKVKNRAYNDILSQEAKNASKINYGYTLDDNNHGDNRMLNFWVAKFGINGSFIKFERLEYDFLQCSNSNEGKTKYKYYGNNYISECYLDFKKFKNEDFNFFYEIFLENNLENQDINLIEVPINITNINYRVYRMFLHYYNSSANTFKYAEKIKLNIHTLDSKQEDKIQYPIFEVTYAEETNIQNLEKFYYTFITVYQSDVSKFVSDDALAKGESDAGSGR